MTRADRLLLVALALVAALSWPLVAGASSQEASEVVITSGSGTTTARLDEDATLVVDGASGPVVVAVTDGCARVVESGCPDQVCVRTGPVSAPGSLIACVPNGVTVRVGGGDRVGYDARLR